MSTKIYNAYRVNGDMSVVKQITQRTRKLYHEHMVSMLHAQGNLPLKKFFYDEKQGCNAIMDFLKYKDKDLSDLPVYVLRDTLEFHSNRQIWHDLNFMASIMLYTDKDSLYIQFFGIETCKKIRKYIAGLERKGILSDYHYQDQTEHPDDITDKEWNERRRTWDRIFKDSLIFSSAGWSNELHSDLFSVCYDYKEMLK